MYIKKIVKALLPKFFLKRILAIKEKLKTKEMILKSKGIQKFNFSYPLGVNLIGDIQAETGLGQSMRMLANAIMIGNVPFMVRQINASGIVEHMEREWDYKIEKENKYGINIIHINNSIWADSYRKFSSIDLDYRYNIAFWLWELEEFPDEWIPCIDTVDEIWTPSEFISKSIRCKTNKPVLTMPYGIQISEENLLPRIYFNLPEDKFLFLVMYDFMSISDRKNPKGVLDAYKKAFAPTNENVGLVIKINHADDCTEVSKLQKQLEEYPNIYYITDNLSRNEVDSLIAAVDVLVSLHRAEGFGLPIAEAMYLGTAVIATNWSAPSEFTSDASACLVDYNLVNLDEDIGPYKKGNRWADANIDQAAQYMQNLFNDETFYNIKVENGKNYIKNCLSVEKISIKINKRIKEIYSKTDK